MQFWLKEATSTSMNVRILNPSTEISFKFDGNGDGDRFAEAGSALPSRGGWGRFSICLPLQGSPRQGSIA